MSVTPQISAEIGRVTGAGIAKNLRRHYSPWLLRGALALLVVANSVNLGADLGAMAQATQLLTGGPVAMFTILFGAISIAAETFFSYARYSNILKWLTLSLLTYVAVVFVVHVPVGEALRNVFVPSMTFDKDHVEALVALLGTTISPYLFFWQAAQEVEEQTRRHAKPLYVVPSQAEPELERIRIDTWVGMGYSNLIALFIIIATAATLHAQGVTDIQTSADAAKALKPVAGIFAEAIFAIGIIGTGLLAVPVLAGSVAYAVCEAFGWREGLNCKPREARSFYGTIAAATLMGIALNFMGIDPIKALYWSAVLNGLLAAPLMAAMLLIACNPKIMGELKLSLPMRLAGWLAAAVMAAASVAFLVL
jgi:Mn2+/Fe2+ NRAMP family transporter